MTSHNCAAAVTDIDNDVSGGDGVAFYNASAAVDMCQGRVRLSE